MKTTLPPTNLSFISARATSGLFAVLALTASAVAALEWSTNLARTFDTAGCLALAALFCVLALTVRLALLKPISAQRVGAATAALYLVASLHQVWFSGPPGGVNLYAVATGSAWLLALDVVLFMCMQRAWATGVALAVAAVTASFAFTSALPPAPELRVLVANLLLAQLLLCALLYGVAVQVRRLASLGVTGLPTDLPAGAPINAQSISDLVSSRESALAQLLSQVEQDQQTATLREAELRTMLDAFPGVVLRIESDGALSYCNERAAALRGQARTALEGQPAVALLGDAAYQRTCLRMLQIQAGGQPMGFETSITHSDGSAHELLMTQFAVAAPAGGRAAWYQIGVDIGERKRVENALAQAKAEAERANQAKSRFISNMSHELRTPLNAVLGLAQMLRVQSPHLGPQQQLHLRAMAEAGKELLALVDETLDLSRMDAGDMRVACQPLNLVELVRSTLDSVAAVAAAQQVTLAPPPCVRELWVQADPVRLRQVLLNLLSNAIKYNHRGGGVAVRVARRNGEALLVVQDTGQGLTPQQHAQLFQPFNRLGAEHSGVQGTGIGLSIAQGLVQLMRGRIEVRSQIGVGSEFTVMLPLAEAQLESAPTAADSAYGALDENFQTQGALLYVEDNDVNVLVFEACLSRRPGVQLQVARNVADALAQAQQQRFDLVVLDQNLPDGSGLALAEELHRLPGWASVPTVLLTADASLQTNQRAQQHGISQVWLKPFHADRLLRDIDKYLAAVVSD